MIKNYIKKSEPNTIITLDYSEIYWRYRLNELGGLQQFKEEYMEVFDERYFMNINGTRKTLILENDVEATKEVRTLADRVAGKPQNINTLTSLNPKLLDDTFQKEFKPYLNAIRNVAPHNICIDSLFKDRLQFAWMVNNFLWNIRGGIKLNYFIISHGTLLTVLNEECEKREIYAYDSFKNDGRYKEREFFHLNSLIKLVEMNRVYDISDGLAHHIEYDYASDKFHVQETYLWDTSNCTKTIDNTVTEKKSIWS